MDPYVDALPARGRGRTPATNTTIPNPASTQINGTASGPWCQRGDSQNTPRELRRPRESPQGLPTNTAVSDAQEVVVAPVSSHTFTLSAEAKEFVPRFRAGMPDAVREFVPRGHSSGEAHNVREFVPRSRETPGKQYRHQRQSNERWQPQPDDDDEVTPEEVALNHLTEVTAHLAVDPASFDLVSRPLLDAFGSWLDDSDTSLAVVAALFQRSVADANFRFNGARLCHELNNKYASQFRTLLLNRCRIEHGLVMAADPSRAHGYLLFMADLFVTLEVAKGTKSKIAILGQAVLETITYLLASPAHDNVKCVCQSLKLCGHHLTELSAEQVDAVFARLQKINMDKRTGGATQLLILNIANLRRENWGMSTPAAQAEASAVATQLPPPPNGPTFYGPDGMVLTQEESQFLQENVTSSTDPDDSDSYSRDHSSYWEQDDGMNEEVEAAFEQFLLLGKTTH